MPPSGGSPDWGIPCVPQRCPLAESMGVAEPARTSLRRTVCAACGAEFFLYEKMGRRAIVPAGSISEAGSTSEVGGGRKRPSPPPPPKITGIQGDLIPLAGARGQRPRGLPPCEEIESVLVEKAVGQEEAVPLCHMAVKGADSLQAS